MKKAWMLLLLLCCTGCTALPAEERSFAVALGISKTNDVWMVCVRVPNYQSGGGYKTVSANGESFPMAMAALNAASPMELHLGQLRIIIVNRNLAETEDFAAVISLLQSWQDMRLQANVCVTEDDVLEIMNALSPLTGSRLSKSLDVLFQTRQEQGVILEAPLARLHTSQQRQSPVFCDIALRKEASEGKTGSQSPEGQKDSGNESIQLAGMWLADWQIMVRSRLSAEETRLLAILSGQMKKGSLTLAEGTVRLLDARTSLSLHGSQAEISLHLRCDDQTLQGKSVEQAVTDACYTLLNKIAAAGCDALGLGRKAIVHAATASQWRNMQWSERFRQMTWHVTVKVQRSAAYHSVKKGDQAAMSFSSDQAALAGLVEGST